MRTIYREIRNVRNPHPLRRYRRAYRPQHSRAPGGLAMKTRLLYSNSVRYCIVETHHQSVNVLLNLALPVRDSLLSSAADLRQQAAGLLSRADLIEQAADQF